MSDLETNIDARFRGLLGTNFSSGAGDPNYVWELAAQEAQGWLIGAANLIGIVTGDRGIHYEQAQKVLHEAEDDNRLSLHLFRKMQGILSATFQDRSLGLLTNVRYADFAITFDDFLDHAADFHKSGKLQESSVLASAVLEDAMRRPSATRTCVLL